MAPPAPGHSDPDLSQVVSAVVAAHRHEPGPLLQILRDVQGTLGCVPRDAVPLVADALNLSRADVYGVISFYHDLRETPAAPTTVRVCRAEACQSVGAEALADHARQSLATDFGGTTVDGRIDLEQAFCLGNCALGPSVMVDQTLHGRVDPTRFDQLVGGAS